MKNISTILTGVYLTASKGESEGTISLDAACVKAGMDVVIPINIHSTCKDFINSTISNLKNRGYRENRPIDFLDTSEFENLEDSEVEIL